MPHYSYLTPFGPIQLHVENNLLHRIELNPSSTLAANRLLSRAAPLMATRLDAYFADNSSTFELPLYQQGTDFQRRVWQALKAIPCGETRSYKQLAEQLKSHPRAIGGACRANPFPIVVPCHRVVAVNGLGGFAGDTQGKLLQIKKWLLQHEGYTAT